MYRFDAGSPARALKALGLFVFMCAALAGGPTASLRAAQGPPAGLPTQAAAQADVVVDGELEVLVEDYAGGARVMHHLRTATERLDLLFDDNTAPGLLDGTRVRARGRRVGNALQLASAGSLEVVALASSATFGEQRTLVILVNFQDNLQTPESWSTVYTTTFQNVSNFYRENSYGQTWFTGDVAGYYTLPMTSGACDYNTIASLGEQAATNAGIAVSAYSHRMFVFPKIAACSWWGLGTVGGNPARAWVNGTYALFVSAHELGHNFGNYHSKSRPCDAAGCTTIEYGDDHDIMGNIAAAHTNAYQKERLGWLNYGTSPPVQTVSSSGAYTIEPLSAPGSYPKALKILKSGTTAGSRTFYYVEVRSSYGADAAAAPGVIIHTGAESSGDTSWQIDLAPAVSGYDSILDVGQTFTDSALGVTIKTLAAGSGGATIDVGFGTTPPSCVTRAPTMTLSPSAAQTVDAGQTASYSVRVHNNDDATCTAATFTLGATAPSGWTTGWDVPSVAPAPGTDGYATLRVTPPSTATGTSNFTATATRPSGPGGSVTGSVQIATVTPPATLTVTATATNTRNVVDMTATVKTGGTSVAGAAVTFRVTNPLGVVSTFSASTNAQGVATASYRLKPKDPAGTYQVVATATSSGVTGSAATSFVN